MSYPVTLIQRAIRTIQSCRTVEQLDCAKNYMRLIIREYSKCHKDSDRFDGWEQYCKAKELSLELNDVLKNQLDSIGSKC